MSELDKYRINEHGVAQEPEIVYRSKGENLAWQYIQLTVAGSGEQWDYGYNTFGGGSPCVPNMGKFKSKEEAIAKGMERIYKWVKEVSVLGYMSKSAQADKLLEDYKEFYETRNQLSLF